MRALALGLALVGGCAAFVWLVAAIETWTETKPSGKRGREMLP